MSSLEPFVRRVKPALDNFLRAHSKQALERLESELLQFNWIEMKIFHIQILVPLVIKLEEISEDSQELRTGTINCIRTVTSNLYLNDVKGLRTMLIILLRQIRNINEAATKKDLSEEIKLAAISAITEALRRSTTDVLELFYTKDSVSLLGQLLLTLVEFIELEKYRQIINASMTCLMTSFYVHDEADFLDVVLRNQVADTLFLFVPKVVSILIKTSMGDEKLGETIKSTAIKALGRILCVICEETNYQSNTFNGLKYKELIDEMGKRPDSIAVLNGYINKNNKTVNLEERLKCMQGNGRCPEWFEQTSKKLSVLLGHTYILRSHQSIRIRYEYAIMCSNLIQNCVYNLKDSFEYLLENIVALAEDEVECIRQVCQVSMQNLQENLNLEHMFNEKYENLFDKHLTRLPRIINCCDENEQYAEFLFIKGLLKNLSANKLHLLFAVPKNLEMFSACLISIVDMEVTKDLLVEECSLRHLNKIEITGSKQLRWRQFKHLKSDRCIQTIRDICGMLGHTKKLNRIIFEYLLELFDQESTRMNEILLVMLWIATGDTNTKNQLIIVDMLLSELLNERHWYLVLQPDEFQRLNVTKQSNWLKDHTPGLYESAFEIRIQDYDSDDERNTDNEKRENYVSIVDAEFNVLHTCVVLDVLGHCATYIGDRFDSYLFRCLHHVLLKIAGSNSLVYEAAFFALTSMQKALHFKEISQLIETYNDYITYHLKMLLKRVPNSSAAVDILGVVIQFSNRNALPHFRSIFETIQDECTKTYQAENINSYLKAYNAFLHHIDRWHKTNTVDIDQTVQFDEVIETNILSYWLEPIINEELDKNTADMDFTNTTEDNTPNDIDSQHEYKDIEVTNLILPNHIQVVKNVLNQVFKFLTCTNHVHQILALECLISGIPLLNNYEDELLPLVHLIWQPLVEKFQQKNPVVLYRCFSLLNVLAFHAKDFILKRSLDDIIPFLRRFLYNAARNSNNTCATQTQEYKLQKKLLDEFGDLIQNIQIEGRQLNDIAETITLYLSMSQPIELQNCAIRFFQKIRLYNGPLSYLVVMKRAHLRDYTVNITKLLHNYQII